MKIETEISPTVVDQQVILNGLRQHNDRYVPATEDLSFAVFLRDADGEIAGGVLARAGRGWLKIGTLWVAASLRGQGYGARLLAAAEAEGRQHGCHSAYLDSFTFQAPAFYEKCGYEIFGILENFPEGHKRYFMRKLLRG